jgi:apolipoprotein D and lipocalin family protein
MPPFPGEGDYWIVRLDESYSYAVVSSPDYRHLWVFYRSPKMSEQLYQNIYNDLKQDGYHVEKLRKTIQ